jgi:hypothetical protein
MRTFHRLHPSKDWDRARVTKPHGSIVYIVDLYCVDKRIETIEIYPPLSNLLQELQAMGCNVSSHRQYLPKHHQDI